MTHPGFLDQPFVKVPNPHPDESIDFRAGEVVYSNPKALDWSRFGYLATLSFWLHEAVVGPFGMFYKTHIPNEAMSSVMEGRYAEYSAMAVDTMGVFPLAYPATIGALLYLFFKFVYIMTKPFVTKMQYSRNKDLLFVTYASELGIEKEIVCEMANIEHVTPVVKSSNMVHSVMDKGGFMVLKDLSGDNMFCGKFFFVTCSQNGR